MKSLLAAALRVRELEDRLRFSYIRRVPAPILAHVDPPIRAAAALFRRAAAVPLYLHQELAEWTGSLAGEPLRITSWGSSDAVRLLLPVFFDDEPTADWKGRRSLPRVLRGASDVMVAATTPALAPLMRRAGCWIVPALVRQGADLEATQAVREHASSGLKNDRRRILREGLRSEIFEYSPQLSETFYRRYLTPHVRSRFAGREEPTSFAAIDRQFAAGFALAIIHPEHSEPDAMSVNYVRGDTLFSSKAGVLDGNPALIRGRALAAIDDSLPDVARSLGLRMIDAGRGLPWRADGVTNNKWKWGYRPIPDANQTLEFAVRVAGADGERVRRRLADQQLIVRTPGGFRLLTTKGWMSPGESIPWPGREGAS